MVEHVGGAFGHDDVARRVHVGADAECHFAQVADVHVGVHDDDALGEHHLAHAPKAVHQLHGMVGELFLHRHDHHVMERAFRRQAHVHQFREVHFEHRQEQPHAGIAEIEILHRRTADDGARINRVAPMRDRGDVETRIRLRQRVVTGMIAERPFHAEWFLRVHVAFKHEVAVRRHLQRKRLALHHLNRLLPQITGQHHLVHAIRQRGGGAERVDRIASETDRHWHPRPQLDVTAEMAGTGLVDLPVHERRLAVNHLHPIHADVAHAGVRVRSEHHR